MSRNRKLLSRWLLTGLLIASYPLTCAWAAEPTRTATAIFASGCFWCTESDFEKLPGVISAESGYIDGKTANPTYQEVSSGATGYTEAVRVVYDPAQVTYPRLLDHFWKNVDPTVKNRQFCDVGSQYRSGIYWQTEAERKAAEESRDALLKSGRFKEIHTEIKAASTFYPAEGYHQDYYKKNPVRYGYYRNGCGRDTRLQQLWGAK
jgi:peptide-methionine (S)-S-oxide reductase